jgi:hypothetical protein
LTRGLATGPAQSRQHRPSRPRRHRHPSLHRHPSPSLSLSLSLSLRLRLHLHLSPRPRPSPRSPPQRCRLPRRPMCHRRGHQQHQLRRRQFPASQDQQCRTLIPLDDHQPTFLQPHVPERKAPDVSEGLPGKLVPQAGVLFSGNRPQKQEGLYHCLIPEMLIGAA